MAVRLPTTNYLMMPLNPLIRPSAHSVPDEKRVNYNLIKLQYRITCDERKDEFVVVKRLFDRILLERVQVQSYAVSRGCEITSEIFSGTLGSFDTSCFALDIQSGDSDRVTKVSEVHERSVQ
jgi:hypothetical protein